MSVGCCPNSTALAVTSILLSSPDIEVEAPPASNKVKVEPFTASEDAALIVSCTCSLSITVLLNVAYTSKVLDVSSRAVIPAPEFKLLSVTVPEIVEVSPTLAIPSNTAIAAILLLLRTSKLMSVRIVPTASTSVKSSPPSCMTNSPIFIELATVNPEVAEYRE